MNVDRIKRLPKWAQDHIKTLERDLAHAKDHISALGATTASESPITWSDTPIKDKPLPAHARVRFRLGDGAIECSIVEGMLRVSECRSGKLPALSVLPRASNVVCVQCVRWQC